MLDAQVLTKAETRYRTCSTGGIFLPTGRFQTAGGLVPANVKVPRVAFDSRIGRVVPLLVVEAGFNPVVLVCIDEDKTMQEVNIEDGMEDHGELEDYEDHLENNVSDIDDSSAHSAESTISAYEAQMSRFASSPTLASRFAYPLSAVELWRYGSTVKTVVQSGPRVTLLPTRSTPEVSFTRMDFGLPTIEENNEFHLPLAPLAMDFVGPARVMLAYERY